MQWSWYVALVVVAWCSIATIGSLASGLPVDADARCTLDGADAPCAGGSAPGRCAAYSNRLPDGSMGFCAGYVRYAYFLPEGKTQKDIELAATAEFRDSGGILSTLALVLPTQCATRIKVVLCASYFPRCELADEYFLDMSCPAEKCKLVDPANSCGDALVGTSNRPPGGYLARCETSSRPCVVSPGYVPGRDYTWVEAASGKEGLTRAEAAALLLSPPPVANMTAACDSWGLVYDPSRRSCLRAVATTPCKDVCDTLHSDNRALVTASDGSKAVDAVCPLVSGPWAIFGHLFTPPISEAVGLTPESSMDPYVQSILESLKARATCDSILSCVTNKDSLTINLGSILGGYPACSLQTGMWGTYACQGADAPYMFGAKYSQEYGPADYVEKNSARPSASNSLGAMIEARAKQLGGSTCGCIGDLHAVNASSPYTWCAEEDASSCNSVANVGLCFSPAVEGVPLVEPAAYSSTLTQPQYANGNDDDVCADSLESSVNQPSEADAEMLGRIYGVNASAIIGMYFLQAADGLPELPHYYPPLQAAFDPEGTFMNQPLRGEDGATPTELCRGGGNSVQCIDALVQESYKRIPSWALPKCKSAYRQWVCSRAKMKLEVKRLCLVLDGKGCAATPEEGAADDRMPFIFALPRFPSYNACMRLHTECDSLFDLINYFLPKETGDELRALLDCNQSFALPCSESDLKGRWRSSVWSGSLCEGASGNSSDDGGDGAAISLSFDDLPAFPEKQQLLFDFNKIGFLADQSDPVVALAATIFKDSIDALNAAFTTNVSDAAGDTNVTLGSDECSCPYPLLRKPNDDQLGLLQQYLPASLNLTKATTCCQLPCILPTYERSQYEVWWTMQLAMGVVGTICGIFLIVTFGVFKEKRSQRLILYYSICSTAISVVFVITYAYGTEKMLCKSETEPSGPGEYGMCFFQATTLLYFSLSACCWWFCQIIELFAKIHLQKRRFDVRKQMHLFAWGFPAAILAVAIGLGDVIYYRSPLSFCFIGTRQDAGGKFDIYAFFWPVGFMVIFGILLMTCVLSTIYQTTMRLKTGKKTKKLLAMYRTPVFFVTFFVFIWSFIFAYRFIQDAQYDDYERAGIYWVQCLMLNDVLGVSEPYKNPAADISIMVNEGYLSADAVGCGALIPDAPNKPLTTMMNLGLFAQSIFLFLVFGLQASVVRLWKEKTSTVITKIGMGSKSGSLRRGSSTLASKSSARRTASQKQKMRKRLGSSKNSSSDSSDEHGRRMLKKKAIEMRHKKITELSDVQLTAVVEARGGAKSTGSDLTIAQHRVKSGRI